MAADASPFEKMHARPRTAAILAGGRARRFGGACKPLLEVAGARIIDRQLAILRPLFDRILVVANAPAPFAALGLEVIADLRPGLGPLAGLEAALAATAAESLFLVAGDMPALDPRAIALVLEAFARDAVADAAAFVGARGPEPLHAVYARRILPAVRARLDGGQLAARDLLAELRLVPVDDALLRAFDPERLALANVNAPDDLHRLAARLESLARS